MSRRFLTLIILIIMTPLSANFAPGSTAVQVQEADAWVLKNEALVDYPNTVTFRLETDPAVTIVEATLTYDVEQIACLDVSTQVPVAGDGSVFEWQWVMIRSGNPPPGSTLWWQWTLTDNRGQTFTTSRQELTFTDDRFDWQTVSAGDISVHWYEGAQVGPMLLEAAVSGLAVLEQDLGIEVQDDVAFYIYGSSDDMREAVLYIQDWAGGVAFSEYGTILMGVPPNIAADWGRSTVRHELAHLALEQYGRSCVGGRRPSWLEEGLAMYAEGEPSEQVRRDLDNGLRDNSFTPLRSLNGAFPAHGAEASAAYSQSYSVIQFLNERYGRESIQALIQQLATGKSYDAALQEVYGFNVDGLEQAWRAWFGLPARAVPPTPTPYSAAAVPTYAPIAGPASLPTPAITAPPAAAPESASRLSICGLGLMPLGLLGVFSWRSRKHKATT
jgi:hypothetical protein